MSQVAQKPLPVGKTGNYTVTIDSGWLDSEPLTSENVTAATGMTISSVTSSGNVIQFLATGTVAGRHEVHAEWATATRSDCYTFYIDVIEC